MAILYYQGFIVITLVIARCFGRNALMIFCMIWSALTVVNLFTPWLIVLQLAVVWTTHAILDRGADTEKARVGAPGDPRAPVGMNKREKAKFLAASAKKQKAQNAKLKNHLSQIELAQKELEKQKQANAQQGANPADTGPQPKVQPARKPKSEKGLLYKTGRALGALTKRRSAKPASAKPDSPIPDSAKSNGLQPNRPLPNGETRQPLPAAEAPVQAPRLVTAQSEPPKPQALRPEILTDLWAYDEEVRKIVTALHRHAVWALEMQRQMDADGQGSRADFDRILADVSRAQTPTDPAHIWQDARPVPAPDAHAGEQQEFDRILGELDADLREVHDTLANEPGLPGIFHNVMHEFGYAAILARMVPPQNQRATEPGRDTATAPAILPAGLQPDSAITRISAETARANALQKEVAARGITRLVHFTRIENLPSILQNGLMSRDALQAFDLAPLINDQMRLDQATGAVSLSISHPNDRFLFKSQLTSGGDFVVLELDPAVLWQNDCAFCCRNAADHRVRDMPLARRREFRAFTSMFDEIDGLASRSAQGLGLDAPTDVQAEVLVFDRIDPRHITRIVARDPKHFGYFPRDIGDIPCAVHSAGQGYFAKRGSSFAKMRAS
ncbi:DarT ssDNA thymidine ADP-ribosyltransferase family protein [Phaeobacter sp. J2-8]|uniref:DarT ssDNA thymidine ADP-ribosyltransferase family protein n=1 Tax=Phaeobacter sp. J2-8 TaxID=2931394 RepID=UPI001FD2A8DE|nr:DarT ssDNA thymidine ADP-ribosyltransferase family protein [Phaeobacter sp. J2-8]MCJ7874568.1 DarT ssDNA thymidine ADP-ribosyltransferase family protein [Phaeobacter sp. J2-8]